MAIFGKAVNAGVKVDEVPDDPNHVPDNTYRCCVVSAEEAITKAGDKVGLTISWQIVEGDYVSSFPFNQWLEIPFDDDHFGSSGEVAEYYNSAEVKKMLSYVKKLYLGLGYTEDELETVETEDLLTREAYVTVKNKQNKKNPEYKNLNVVNIKSIESVGIESGQSDDYDPFAPVKPSF